MFPKAKIPTVELPAADPPEDAALDAVAEALMHPENVYLSRVVDAAVVDPKANIANVPTDVPGTGHSPAFCHPTIWSMVHTPEAAPHWFGPAGVTGVLVISPP